MPEKVKLTVSGPTGSGKSRILAEVEIALKAVGISVTWAKRGDRNAVHSEHWAESHAAWQPELPEVELLEINEPRCAAAQPQPYTTAQESGE